MASGSSSWWPSGWAERLPPSLEAAGAHVADAADAVSRAASSLYSRYSQQLLDTTQLQDRMRRARAQWQWGPHGLGPSGLRVPLPTDLDQRFVLAAASLGKVVMDQASDQDPAAAVTRHPVTTALVLLELAAFFAPGGLPLRELCLSPFCVVEQGQWTRLLTPAFIHMDGTHLLCNLATALPDCWQLEAGGGSLRFGGELVGLTALSHAIYVAWSWGSKALAQRSTEYYSVGAVGLSSVAFALQVVAGEQRRCRVLVLGVPVPAQCAWVFGVTLAHLCSPDTSFAGHMSGVLAGVVYVYAIKPVARLLRHVALGALPARTAHARQAFTPATARGPRFWGAGTTGQGTFTASQLRARAQARSQWWKEWAWGLGTQLGLVALATGVYLLSRQRAPSRHPINTWQLR